VTANDTRVLVRFGGTPKKIHYTRGSFAACTLDRPLKERTLVNSSRVSAAVNPGEDELEVARRLAAQLIADGLEQFLCKPCRQVWDR
jgi:hypothetical protein